MEKMCPALVTVYCDCLRIMSVECDEEQYNKLVAEINDACTRGIIQAEQCEITKFCGYETTLKTYSNKHIYICAVITRYVK